MNLHPARYEGETFTTYQLRRAAENAAVKQYLRNPLRARNLGSRPKHGKAETKRLKRERRVIRQPEA